MLGLEDMTLSFLVISRTEQCLIQAPRCWIHFVAQLKKNYFQTLHLFHDLQVGIVTKEL